MTFKASLMAASALALIAGTAAFADGHAQTLTIATVKNGDMVRMQGLTDAFTEQRDIYEKRIIPRTEDTLKLAIADYRGKRTDFFSLIETYRELLMFETQLARIEASLAGTIAQVERAVGCPQ